MIAKEPCKVRPSSSTASGSKCKNASPNKIHAEKAKKHTKIFFSFTRGNQKVQIPTKETPLTNKTDKTEYIIFIDTKKKIKTIKKSDFYIEDIAVDVCVSISSKSSKRY